MNKTQLEKVHEKLILQAGKVIKKIRPNSSREISNQEIQLSLYHYSTSRNLTDEYGEKYLEWMHERLTRLNEEQMSIVKSRFWRGLTLEQIAEEHSIAKSTVHEKLLKIYEILRKDD